MRVIVVGAGVGGLSAALSLAVAGCDVAVVEKAAAPGGKMRQVIVDGAPIDAGPTVLTMRWVFDELFAEAGTDLDAHVTLTPASIIARHAWTAEERLDLFADMEASVDAIGTFAGRSEAEGYRTFCGRAARMFETLDQPFIRSQRPRLDQLVASYGLLGMGKLRQISPFNILWSALGDHFRDPRLRQLFGRYATYCGSSPFLAPATLMLVAHVERVGVWYVRGGMHALAKCLASLAAANGASFRYEATVEKIELAGRAVSGLRLSTGELLEADAVIFTGDAAALCAGLLGDDVKKAAPAISRSARSLSAMTFAIRARTEGFPLVRHNVFFSRNYEAEFKDVFGADRTPRDPTVYICAQDRLDDDSSLDEERLLALVNAPPSGDMRRFAPEDIARCENNMNRVLEKCGLTITRRAQVATTPSDFNGLFPATGGALYGPASHGWQASFQRSGARSRIPGLYLAGGSVHPGPGVPMAAMSGRLAAAALLRDRGSTPRSRGTVTSGGTSTR